MENLNAKEKIQRQVNHWVKMIRKFENDLNSIDPNSKDFHQTKSLQTEYKGRIYAVRFFEMVLGFEFDTNFISD